MKFERKVIKNGGTLYIGVDPSLAKYMEIEEGSEIVLQDDEGKHGKFISFWRKDQEKVE